MVSWWAPELHAELSQGDVLVDAKIASAVSPVVALSKVTGKANKLSWVEGPWVSNNEGFAHCLARGRTAACILLSHSCDIDKDQRRKQVIVAPVREIQALPADEQVSVLSQRQYAKLPLPDVASLGSCYADLRMMLPLSKSDLQALTRVASMSDTGLVRLQVQLVAFFTRRDFDPERA